MKLLLIALISVLTLSTQDVQAQTKEDTKEWISTKLTEFRSYPFEIRYSGSTMIIKQGSGDDWEEQRFNLKDVSSVKVTAGRYGGYGLELKIIMRPGTSKIMGTYKNGRWRNGEITTGNLNVLEIGFEGYKHASCVDDICARMEKAFIHLIVLNGGEIKEEAF